MGLRGSENRFLNKATLICGSILTSGSNRTKDYDQSAAVSGGCEKGKLIVTGEQSL